MVRLPLGLLAAAGFLSTSGARVVDALLAPIAQEFGSGIPGASFVMIGFVVPYGLMQLAVGPVADRYGKLRIITCALVGYALANLACAASTSLPLLTFSRVAAGSASAGLIPVCLAYLADTTTYEDRQVAISQFLTGVVFAQIMAGPLGGMFGEFVDWRGVFLLLAASATVLAVVIGRRSARLGREQVQHAPARQYRDLLDPRCRKFLLAALANGTLFGGIFPFMAPMLHEQFGLSYAGTGLVLSFFGLGAMLQTLRTKALLAVFGERRQMMVGALAAASGLVIALISRHWGFFLAAETLMGLGYFMLHSVMLSRATEMLPNARGTATSGFAFVLFMGQALGALAGGAVIARWGFRPLFWLDAAGIVALGQWLSLRHRTMAAPVTALRSPAA